MRILVFGDSIAQGFWDVDGGWVNMIRKQFDQQVICGTNIDSPTVFNLGVSGDSSSDILMRFEHEVKARASEELAIIISVGVNDSRIEAGTPYSDTLAYAQNLDLILKLAKQYSTKIIFIGLTPCVDARTNPVAWGDIRYSNERLKNFDGTLSEFCMSMDMPFVPTYEAFTEAQSRDDLLPDGLHPNSEGHRLIASLVTQKLDKLSSTVWI